MAKVKALKFQFEGGKYTYTWFEDATEYVKGDVPFHGTVHRIYTGDVVAIERFHKPGKKQWEGLDVAANFIARGIAVEVEVDKNEMTDERSLEEMTAGLPILDAPPRMF